MSHKNPIVGLCRYALVVLAALTVPLAVASPAVAVPKGEYAVFADCPLSNAELAGCIVARAEGGAGGSITFGNETVPIVNTQTLQGGFIEEESGALKFVGAADGNTLSKTAQKVPGGLLGIVKCNEITGEGKHEKELRKACEEVFENKITGVYATVELAAPASSIGLNEFNLETEMGTALSLPVKVKLENPLLGNNCYIGSNSSPIVVPLTTGTSGSLKGKLGEINSRAEGGILVITNDSLVNNTIAVPGANGCGFAGLLNSIVDGRLQIPSAAPKNKVTLNGTLEQTGAGTAREHE